MSQGIFSLLGTLVVQRGTTRPTLPRYRSPPLPSFEVIPGAKAVRNALSWPVIAVAAGGESPNPPVRGCVFDHVDSCRVRGVAEHVRARAAERVFRAEGGLAPVDPPTNTTQSDRSLAGAAPSPALIVPHRLPSLNPDLDWQSRVCLVRGHQLHPSCCE